MLARRYGTRNVEQLYGVLHTAPRIVSVIFFCVFILQSVPGTAAYCMEFFILMSGMTAPLGVIVFFCLQLVLAVFSRNS